MRNTLPVCDIQLTKFPTSDFPRVALSTYLLAAKIVRNYGSRSNHPSLEKCFRVHSKLFKLMRFSHFSSLVSNVAAWIQISACRSGSKLCRTRIQDPGANSMLNPCTFGFKFWFSEKQPEQILGCENAGLCICLQYVVGVSRSSETTPAYVKTVPHDTWYRIWSIFLCCPHNRFLLRFSCTKFCGVWSTCIQPKSSTGTSSPATSWSTPTVYWRYATTASPGRPSFHWTQCSGSRSYA